MEIRPDIFAFVVVVAALVGYLIGFFSGVLDEKFKVKNDKQQNR